MAKKQTRSRSTRSSKSKSLKRKGGFSRLQFAIYIAVFALIGAFTLWISFAAPTGSCVRNTPLITMDNNYAWAQSGSWGYPGQQLSYFMQITNYDQNCTTDTFTVGITAPQGFTVSLPTNSVTVKSGGIGYLTGYVTSPTSVADGDYTITPTVVRNSTGVAGNSQNNFYKVYSSDTSNPTMFWNNPSEGQILSSKGKGSSSYNIQVSSSDDHAVKNVDIYLDGVLVNSTNCDDTTYICQAVYRWAVSKHAGSHTVLYKSTDWFSNMSQMTVHFSVQ